MSEFMERATLLRWKVESLFYLQLDRDIPTQVRPLLNQILNTGATGTAVTPRVCSNTWTHCQSRVLGAGIVKRRKKACERNPGQAPNNIEPHPT